MVLDAMTSKSFGEVNRGKIEENKNAINDRYEYDYYELLREDIND